MTAVYSWQTLVAALAAIILLVIFSSGAWRRRFRRLEQQRNELSLAVMLRTREIQKEKSTVERQKQQIQVLLDAAQRSNRLKDEFLANISHEIRTPLHGVIGMTGLALETDLSEDQREYLEVAQTSASSLLALLNDVLDFSKIEAGQFALEINSYSLADCLEQAAGAFPVIATQKGLSFTVEVAPDVPETLEGDPMRVGQILTNLLSNAVKFTERGSIRLTVFRETAVDASTRVCFQVEDTGIGIPKDKLETVFEPFRQADGSTTRKYGGTGLGLSICRRLIQQMDGELILASEAGRGSTFKCSLPLTVPCI